MTQIHIITIFTGSALSWTAIDTFNDNHREIVDAAEFAALQVDNKTELETLLGSLDGDALFKLRDGSVYDKNQAKATGIPSLYLTLKKGRLLLPLDKKIN